MAQYDKIADEYSELHSRRPLRDCVLIPSVLKVLGSVTGKSVMDVGCGDGNFSRIVKLRGAGTVVGNDVSSKMIQIAEDIEKEKQQGIEYATYGLAKLPSISEFDIVSAINVLHYAETKDELNTMCTNIGNNLKKGGRFIGINVNPDFVFGGVTNQYGFFYQRDKKQIKEGDTIKVTLTEKDIAVSFNVWSWSKRTYQDAFRLAGFKDLEWHKLMCSPKCDTGFWQGYIDNPAVVPVSCVKA